MGKVIRFIGKVLSAYHQFFTNFSADPKISSAALFGLVCGGIVIMIDFVLYSTLEQVSFSLLRARIFAISMFVVMCVTYSLGIPEPKENKYIVYVSLSILSVLFLTPLILLLFG